MSCVKCGDICRCLNITSPDGSIIVRKTAHAYGCDYEVSIDYDDVPLYTLEFNETTRELCIRATNGAATTCVQIPEKVQYLTINGDQLTISDGNSVTLPTSPTLNITSQSIRVQQSGTQKHNVILEVEPSMDANNAIHIGSDGKIFAQFTGGGGPGPGDFETFLNNPQTFKKKITFLEGINVKGLTDLDGDLDVQGAAAFHSDVDIDGDLNVDGDSTFNNVLVKGTFKVQQGTEVTDVPIYRGEWDPTVLYYKNNIVRYNGSLWIYKFAAPTVGNIPFVGSQYWDLYLEGGQPGSDGKYTEMRFNKNGSSVSAPPLNVNDPNPTGWTIQTPVVGQGEYLWMTQTAKTSAGALINPWSTPVRLTGLQGPPGEAGGSSSKAFKSIVFKRSVGQPITPTGGTWAFPVPTGWSDGVPSGNEQLWMSTRVFTEDTLFPQEPDWTEPVAITDTATIDYEFSAVATSPGTPDTNPSNWHNDATPADIWMAIQTTVNGVKQGWQVAKIKGENGNDGLPGPPGVAGPAGPFLSYAGNWSNTVQYYGNPDRIQAVYFNGNYYVTRVDAGGNIPAGTLPTNTTYWNQIQGNFDSIATGLLLAQTAYIKNLGVSFLRTGAPLSGGNGTEHIEIYPSFNTLSNLRANGDPGYGGLSDGDLTNLANTIIFYASSDTGARDSGSVATNQLMKMQAIGAVTIPSQPLPGGGSSSSYVVPASTIIYQKVSDGTTLRESNISPAYIELKRAGTTRVFLDANGGLSKIDGFLTVTNGFSAGSAQIGSTLISPGTGVVTQAPYYNSGSTVYVTGGGIYRASGGVQYVMPQVNYSVGGVVSNEDVTELTIVNSQSNQISVNSSSGHQLYSNGSAVSSLLLGGKRVLRLAVVPLAFNNAEYYWTDN